MRPSAGGRRADAAHPSDGLGHVHALHYALGRRPVRPQHSRSADRPRACGVEIAWPPAFGPPHREEWDVFSSSSRSLPSLAAGRRFQAFARRRRASQSFAGVLPVAQPFRPSSALSTAAGRRLASYRRLLRVCWIVHVLSDPFLLLPQAAPASRQVGFLAASISSGIAILVVHREQWRQLRPRRRRAEHRRRGPVGNGSGVTPCSRSAKPMKGGVCPCVAAAAAVAPRLSAMEAARARVVDGVAGRPRQRPLTAQTYEGGGAAVERGRLIRWGGPQWMLGTGAGRRCGQGVHARWPHGVLPRLVQQPSSRL